MAARRSTPQPLSPLAFAKRIANETPPGAVVLAGTERWFRDRGAEAVIHAVLPEGDPGGALVRLDGRRPEDQPRIRQADDELRATSLFAPRRVVVIDEPDNARPTRPGKPRLSTELVKGALNDSGSQDATDAVLVLCIARPLKGRNAISPTALLKAGAWVVDCRRLYAAPAPWERGPPHDHELSRYLVGRMRSQFKRSLSLDVAHALSLRVGTDLGPLNDALGQLSESIPADRSLTVDDIAAAFGESRDDPLWSIADAVLDGQPAEALRMTEQAFEHGVREENGAMLVRPDALFLRLNRTLHNQVVQLLAGSEALARGDYEPDVLKAAGVPRFRADDFLRRCRRPPATLARMHHALFDAELGFKSGQVPARLAAERLVMQLSS